MRVLFLGPLNSPLIPYLSERDTVTATSDPLDLAWIVGLAPDLAVSYGYRHILRGEILQALEGHAVNLHISYLPWNRGADPNLWSVLEGTPRGVSILWIDAGVDTGDLIAQRLVTFEDTDTLASSYQRLQAEIQDLFRRVWPLIREGRAPRIPQQEADTYHRVADKARVEHLLTDGWDTPIAALVGALHRRN